jgi:hypothetical protein
LIENTHFLTDFFLVSCFFTSQANPQGISMIGKRTKMLNLNL